MDFSRGWRSGRFLDWQSPWPSTKSRVCTHTYIWLPIPRTWWPESPIWLMTVTIITSRIRTAPILCVCTCAPLMCTVFGVRRSSVRSRFRYLMYNDLKQRNLIGLNIFCRPTVIHIIISRQWWPHAVKPIYYSNIKIWSSTGR